MVVAEMKQVVVLNAGRRGPDLLPGPLRDAWCCKLIVPKARTHRFWGPSNKYGPRFKPRIAAAVNLSGID